MPEAQKRLLLTVVLQIRFTVSERELVNDHEVKSTGFYKRGDVVFSIVYEITLHLLEFRQGGGERSLLNSVIVIVGNHYIIF
ncbi:hypothetical protein BVD23_01240 [Salmonella enterica]|nr:hypothetical protein [Salmonella enterica]EAN4944063.1 hypothetical protein [Salmonella enterica]EBI7616990.1 hypothetical protein [Salmonella enterica]EBI8099167.1 hypothetical protein [Salmonella enterica]EBK3003487.1 hypothetical protein [Salmonella enterica]